MTGSKYRCAEVRDAENIRQLYQASIRGLAPNHYSADQIEGWANREVEAFVQDIQKGSALVCEFEGRIIAYGQIDLETATVPAVYVHPDFVRRQVGSSLLCFLEGPASSAEIRRITVDATLCSVEFFRAQGYAELGSVVFPLPDGSSLPGVRMERVLFDKIEFAPEQPLSERVITCLSCDDYLSRRKALDGLKEQSPAEVLEIIIGLLSHPEQKTRRRAAAALNLFSKLHGEPINVERKANELVDYLEHGEDPQVRLACALGLGRVHSPRVDRAFLRALADPSDQVVQWSCREVGERCGAQGTAALFGLLNHSSWNIRLVACITLIYQRTADQRVVATLEAMSREPEVVKHDAFEDEFSEVQKGLLACCGDECEQGVWGKMASILEKAREVANRHGTEGSTK